MYFFDSYAFIEIIRGNKSYLRFKNVEFATSKLNIMEVYFYLLNNFGKKEADSFYDQTARYATEISDEIIKEAMIFRLQNKSKKLSYIDCIGYILARVNMLKFLTGDKQFEMMENVEFVK